MTGITLEQAQQQLASWLEADAAVSRSQSYTYDGRQLTRADAAAITAKINHWQDMVNRLSGNQRRGVSRVVPC